VNFANHILSHDIKYTLSWIFLKLPTNTFSNLTNKFNVFIYLYTVYITDIFLHFLTYMFGRFKIVHKNYFSDYPKNWK
jgi:hypothetical protein